MMELISQLEELNKHTDPRVVGQTLLDVFVALLRQWNEYYLDDLHDNYVMTEGLKMKKKTIPAHLASLNQMHPEIFLDENDEFIQLKDQLIHRLEQLRDGFFCEYDQ